MNLSLAIDIGGTKIAYGLVDNSGIIKNEIQKTKTPKTVDEIKNILENIIQSYENEVDCIAIATAGAVNKENSKVIGSTGNLAKGYRDIDFKNLSKKPVFVENDANAAAWAEYRIGAAKDYNNSITLTLGTGVGAGIIIEDKLFKGKSGAGPEVHFPMDRNQKRACTCGFYDCFEAYASGPGLQKTAAQIFNDSSITTYDIIQKASCNDPRALEALEVWRNDIALGIVGLNNLFDTDCFVLSGSMEKFVDTEKIEEFVNKNTVTSKTRVFHAKLQNHAGLIGAALLAFDSSLFSLN